MDQEAKARVFIGDREYDSLESAIASAGPCDTINVITSGPLTLRVPVDAPVIDWTSGASILDRARDAPLREAVSHEWPLVCHRRYARDVWLLLDGVTSS